MNFIKELLSSNNFKDALVLRLMFVIFIIFCLTAIYTFSVILPKRIKECEEKGGTYIYTRDIKACIDSKAIIK